MALETCPDLKPLENTSLEELKLKSSSWINGYGTCRVKHEVLRECVLAWENTVKDD